MQNLFFCKTFCKKRGEKYIYTVLRPPRRILRHKKNTMSRQFLQLRNMVFFILLYDPDHIPADVRQAHRAAQAHRVGQLGTQLFHIGSHAVGTAAVHSCHKGACRLS